jgi:hypothetical protein
VKKSDILEEIENIKDQIITKYKPELGGIKNV